MFTGIVEEMGAVRAIRRSPKSARLSVVAKAVLEGLSVGDSVSVNGACLTVVNLEDSSFSTDLSADTLGATTLGALQAGDAVNLERAVRLGERLGGHLVTGHVDGVGLIRARRQDEENLILSVEASSEISRYCVRKGSLTVDGVSLTIQELFGSEIRVSIVPHTAQVTTLGLKTVGSRVNLEADLIAKYVEGFLRPESGRPQKIDPEFLKRKGML